MVIGRHQVNCRTRNMKDQMSIFFSDYKLLTTENKAKGRVDRFIGHYIEEVLMFMWS